jgi:hypothetical protein
MVAPLARMRAIFSSQSGRRLFKRHGAPAYVARAVAFAAEQSASLNEEDHRLIELEVRLAVGNGPTPPLVWDLIGAGYFWALSNADWTSRASHGGSTPTSAGSRNARWSTSTISLPTRRLSTWSWRR